MSVFLFDHSKHSQFAAGPAARETRRDRNDRPDVDWRWLQIGRRDPAPERELDVPEWRLITKSEIAQRHLMKSQRAVRARSKRAGKRLSKWRTQRAVGSELPLSANGRQSFPTRGCWLLHRVFSECGRLERPCGRRCRRGASPR